MSLLFVLGITLCACNGSNREAKPQFKVDFELAQVEGEFDTHTETQNNYLNDTYDSIDKYGKGSSENSLPNSLNLSWSVSNAELDLTGLELKLYENSSNSMNLAASYPLDKDATSTSITNLKVGTNYAWSITAIAGDKKVESKPSNFSTKDGIVRFISIDGLSNVRDCGGWTGLNGKKIRQGLLYRGEEFNKQNYGCNDRQTSSSSVTDPTIVDPDDSKERAKEKPYGQKITASGIQTVLNDIALKTECDIRGYETFDWETRLNDHPTECGGLHGSIINGDESLKDFSKKGIVEEINYVVCPVHTSRDKIYYDNYGKAACKSFFTMLADKETYLPLYFHCAQGKDRTGFLAYLFEAFLGCSKEDMLRDYLLSNLGKTGSVSISKVTSNYNYVDYFDGKEVSTSSGAKYQGEGSSTAEIAYNYLLSCGLTSEQLDTIRETFLED